MANRVLLSRLQRHWNPFAHDPWTGSTFLVEDVMGLVREGKFEETPYSSVRVVGRDSSGPLRERVQAKGSREPFVYDHLRRIAWLVAHGWDASQAIVVDVGIPGLTREQWPIADGNHRYCAALVRGDRDVLCEISGCVNTAKRLLGLRSLA